MYLHPLNSPSMKIHDANTNDFLWRNAFYRHRKTEWHCIQPLSIVAERRCTRILSLPLSLMAFSNSDRFFLKLSARSLKFSVISEFLWSLNFSRSPAAFCISTREAPAAAKSTASRYFLQATHCFCITDMELCCLR